MNKSKEKSSNKSVVLGDSQWFDRYLDICKTINESNSDSNDLYLDILKDLCNDYISDNIVIHLLSLLEQMVPLFDNSDKVEQTVGSLINIYSATEKVGWIRQKYLITTTVIITYHNEMTENNWSLKQLVDSVIQLLIKNSEKPKTVIGLASAECLKEIGSTTPTLLQNAYNRNQFKRDQTLIMSSLQMRNSSISAEDIRDVVKNLPNLSQIDLYHTLSQLFDAIHSQRFQDLISPMLFKPYLTQFTFSSEVHCFHFALQLLLSFGLELFSTVEEQKLLKQLVIVATHPSLTIAHRLLALDYTTSIVIRLKPSAIEWSALEITAFDGPDTQEKKLSILNETQIDNQNLLVCMKPLKSLSLKNNTRATNAFYRVIHSVLSKRNDIMHEIQDLLVSLIFRAPDPHIRRSISLFNIFRDLAKGTAHKIIESLSNMSETERFKSSSEFIQFMFAFQWIFKQKDFDLSEAQLLFILNLIHDNCKRWVDSNGPALECCTAVLYYQNISVSVKQILLSTLEWLMNGNKNDMSVTSLAQIYILALNTLEDDLNIKRVFKCEVETSFDPQILIDCSHDVPFTITRVTTDQTSEHALSLNEMPFNINILFEIWIREECKHRFDRIFDLILFFDSSDATIDDEYEIPILDCNERQLIRLELRSIINKPFDLRISAIFNDTNGTNYRCDHFQSEMISLRDILLPIDIGNDQTFDELCESVLKESDCMQTVLCVRPFGSIELFLSQFKWLSNYTINKTNNFICGTAPDRLLLGTLKLVNKFVNIFLITNNYELFASLYYEFNENADEKQ